MENREVEPAPDEPVDAAPAAASDARLPACNAYIAATTRYMSCPSVDAQTRSALQQGIDAMKQAWTQLESITDPTVLKSVDDACRQALDAIRQTALKQSCPI